MFYQTNILSDFYTKHLFQFMKKIVKLNENLPLYLISFEWTI